MAAHRRYSGGGNGQVDPQGPHRWIDAVVGDGGGGEMLRVRVAWTCQQLRSMGPIGPWDDAAGCLHGCLDGCW